MIRAYYLFLWYTPTFHRYSHREGFLCSNEGKSMRQFLSKQKNFWSFSKTEIIFLVIFKSYPSLLKFPKFMTQRVLKYFYNTPALNHSPPANYLATPSTTSTKPHSLIKFIFYTSHPSPIFQLWPSTVPI